MINDIPTNVVVIFFVLLYIGIKRCFDSVLSLKRLVILPTILIVYSQYSLYESLHYSFYLLLFIAIALIFGCYIGNSKVKNTNILADKEQSLVKLPGSFLYLAVLMGLFFIQFCIHYSIDDHLFFSRWAIYEILTVTAISFLSGILAGMNFTFFMKYLASDSISLPKQD